MITHKPSRFQKASPKQLEEFQVVSFTGLNNNDDPSSIPDTMSPDTRNTNYDSQGSIQNRKGYIKLLTTTLGNPINGMRAAYKSDTTTKQLLYASGTQLYIYDNAGGSNVVTGGPFTANKQWDFDQYGDLTYGVNGTDGVFQYNFSVVSPIAGWGGTSGALSSGLPKYVRIHKNRIWLAGDPAAPSRIYFSDAGTTSFPINNFIDVNTNDGQTITGLAVLLDSMIIFKSNSIWVITGEPSGSGNATSLGNLNMRRANSDVGCTAFRSIVQVESVLFFMHSSGLYVFSNYQAKRISDPVNATFASMNPGFQSLCWGIYSASQKKYLLGYPSATSTTCDSLLVYDTIAKAYLTWDDMPGACAVNFQFNNADTLLVADPVKGIIYQYFNGYADIAGDNGTATSGSTTTLVDTSKAWTTNQFVDAKVYISAGTGVGQTAVVASNTATTLTFAALTMAPAVGSVYTIGGYTSYWTSKIFDFDAPQLTKKYKYLNLFLDSEGAYNLLTGIQVGDAIPVSGFNAPPVSLNANSTTWDQAGITWDQAGIYWDTQSQIFKRTSIGAQGRFIQVRFGAINGNQRWRLFSYSIPYKTKSARAI